MPVKKNNAYAGRNASADRGMNNTDGYARGNRNWNGGAYNDSVRTRRTDTIAIDFFDERQREKYYDITPTAIREKQRKEREEKFRKLKATLKRSRRRSKFRRFMKSAMTLLIAVFVVLFVAYKLFFVAQIIDVTGSERYTSDEIISAAGLDARTNLYSFSSRVAAEKIRFKCPCVNTAQFNRTPPVSVSIEIVEEEPRFYSVIYGEVFTLSDTLRVLGRSELETVKEEGLIHLKIQSVDSIISGSEIKLISERAQRYLENTVGLSEKSEIMDRITCIDLTNDFDTYIDVDNMYRLEIGTQDDLESKLKLAAGILSDPMFDSSLKAYIDLTDTARTSVIIDNKLVFDD